ncbi:HNH endonuclease [Sorangium sp. So ce131]|uniref:HNH endonuclease n=1 Tax=Sorangium sp. So ce131 TaxID=3133282 RepID=UPI003F603661
MSRTYIPKALRELIAQQARRRCGYCLTQEAVVGLPMEIDHIVPESLGGRTEEENLWLACSLCNSHKSDRLAALDPETGEVTRLFNPRRQTWAEHFAWAAEGERILGLTPAGRATVIALHLNRPSLVLSRRAWVSVGWHPPKE